jgi:tetratricopeptide (TPR) repeat protein
MMMEFGACTRCHNDVSQERRNIRPVVCDHCGNVMSPTESMGDDLAEKKFIKIALGISVFLIAGFLQLATWDNHAIEILPLQAKQLVGALNTEDLEKFAQICLDRRKFDCVEREYSKLGERDAKNLLRLGKFQMSRARYAEAVESYRKFFAGGGIDLEGSYQFARALGQVGMVDEAAKYFDYVLGAKPDVLQVTVVTNYVKLLIEAKRLDQAKKLIEDVRGRTETSALFMDNEFKEIEKLGGGAKS